MAEVSKGIGMKQFSVLQRMWSLVIMLIMNFSLLALE